MDDPIISSSCRPFPGSVATNSKKKKKGGSRGKSNRMTEAEEDAALLKTATSARRTVYLNSQPKLLASHCKMHKYQLEGLNWMIKLHDHGINGILADEMGLGKVSRVLIASYLWVIIKGLIPIPLCRRCKPFLS